MIRKFLVSPSLSIKLQSAVSVENHSPRFAPFFQLLIFSASLCKAALNALMKL